MVAKFASILLIAWFSISSIVFAEINEDAWKRLQEQRQAQETERRQLYAAIGISKVIENAQTKRREAEEFQMQREAFALEKKRKELEIMRMEEEIRKMQGADGSDQPPVGSVGIDPKTGQRMIRKNGVWVPEDEA